MDPKQDDCVAQTACRCFIVNHLRSEDIHARVCWPSILLQLGISEDYLRGKRKPGPCPACGGHDRYFFDNRRGRGDFHCRHCGPGDGFALLMRVRGEDFATVRKRVIDLAQLTDEDVAKPATPIFAPREPDPPAKPTRRVWDLLKTSCAVEHCEDARRYLASRGLWPLPAHGLRAHALAEYWHEGQNIGRFPALIAPVRDIGGQLVTAHVTYLHKGAKLTGYPARKLLSALTSREGCAARLMRLDGDVLGIGEGIETSFAAARIHAVPTWAALNAGLLAKFEPPPQVRKLLIFADRDQAGLDAANHLAQRLDIETEILTPQSGKDWNDQ